MILAIETATPACSVALFENGKVLAFAHESVGRGHAERLIPMIAALPGGGRADSIIAGCGPGSFTGIRVGLAAARGLALAWDIPAYGYATHALVAAEVFARNPGIISVTVAMEAGHGQLFVQSFRAEPCEQLDDLQSLSPDHAARYMVQPWVAGTAASRLIAFTGGGAVVEAEVDARNILLLPEALRTRDLAPVYGRGPDAKLPQANAAGE